jgi:hypothetical protein
MRKKIMNSQNMFRLIIQSCLLMVFTFFVFSIQASAQQDKSRGIFPVFEKNRPAQKSTRKTPKSKRRKPYKRKSWKKNTGQIRKSDRPGKGRRRPPVQADISEARARQIGITLWKLNEVRFNSRIETFPLVEEGRRRYLQPERVSIDTVFDSYDKVRFTVESSRRGYLYIVNQEMYRDGTLGNAYLVFPNTRINRGRNLVSPGRPIELPDLNGNPFYFELRPKNSDGQSLTAEILTVIITDRPIPGLRIGSTPNLILESTLDGWKTKWAGRAEVFESDDEDTAYTRNERKAAGGLVALTAEDPLPKTVFLIEANRNSGSLITVPLWYGNE